MIQNIDTPKCNKLIVLVRPLCVKQKKGSGQHCFYIKLGLTYSGELLYYSKDAYRMPGMSGCPGTPYHDRRDCV